MGEHGGLRTGWLAAFGTEGYDGEPPLLEELGVNFGHIKGKVCQAAISSVEQERVRQREVAHDAATPRVQALTGRCVAQKLAKASMVVLRGYR